MASRPLPDDRGPTPLPDRVRQYKKQKQILRLWNSQPHPKMGWDDTKVDTSRVNVEPKWADVRKKYTDQMTDDLLERRKTNPPPRLQQVLARLMGKHPAQAQHEHEMRQRQKTFEKMYPEGLPRLDRRSGGGSFATPEPSPSPGPSPRPPGRGSGSRPRELPRKPTLPKLNRWSD